MSFIKVDNYNELEALGESYGGVYVPTLAEKCLDRKFPAPFKGFAVGNGYLDQKLLGNSWLQFVYYHGLVDTPLWEKLVEECCHDGTKLRKCDFVGSEKKSCQKLIEKVNKWRKLREKCNCIIFVHPDSQQL